LLRVGWNQQPVPRLARSWFHLRIGLHSETFVRVSAHVGKGKGLFDDWSTELLSSILLLVLGLGLVFLAAELFTNAIEWFGKYLNQREGVVGSVLAAVGTALPETSVAVVRYPGEAPRLQPERESAWQ